MNFKGPRGDAAAIRLSALRSCFLDLALIRFGGQVS